MHHPFRAEWQSLHKKVVFLPRLGNADTEDNPVTCRRAVCKALAVDNARRSLFQAIGLVASQAQDPGVAACNEGILSNERPSADLFGNPGCEDEACGFSCQW